AQKGLPFPARLAEDGLGASQLARLFKTNRHRALPRGSWKAGIATIANEIRSSIRENLRVSKTSTRFRRVCIRAERDGDKRYPSNARGLCSRRRQELHGQALPPSLLCSANLSLCY